VVEEGKDGRSEGELKLVANLGILWLRGLTMAVSIRDNSAGAAGTQCCDWGRRVMNSALGKGVRCNTNVGLEKEVPGGSHWVDKGLRQLGRPTQVSRKAEFFAKVGRGYR